MASEDSKFVRDRESNENVEPAWYQLALKGYINTPPRHTVGSRTTWIPAPYNARVLLVGLLHAAWIDEWPLHGSLLGALRISRLRVLSDVYLRQSFWLRRR